MKDCLIHLRDKFRDLYGNLPIEELATNKNLSLSIERIESLFRKLIE